MLVDNIMTLKMVNFYQKILISVIICLYIHNWASINNLGTPKLKVNTQWANIVMSVSYARASRLASSSPKDFDFQFFIYQNETEYTFWWGTRRVAQWFRELPDNTLWNSIICFSTLAAIILVVLQLPHDIYWDMADGVCNVLYALHVIGTWYNDRLELDKARMPPKMIVGYVIDAITYLHYTDEVLSHILPEDVMPQFSYVHIQLTLYYLRLHRPFDYLLALNDKNLKGSVVGTTLKYLYIFLVLRITGAIIWMNFDDMLLRFAETEILDSSTTATFRIGNSTPEIFYRAVYIVNKIFKPIGPAYFPSSDMWRIAFLIAMLSGCLLISGIAVTSLALIIGLYMRPEEVYRERFRLIRKDLVTLITAAKETHVPEEHCMKVETFYRMYWHKQKGVSKTSLLPTFPPTLPATVYTDVYFEAQQKSRILCDLSYQFLSEIAKVMSTIHYIPGDPLIKRNAFKSAIYYIDYGDVEMLTAEDDMTPLLRFTRGSILSPCGGITCCAASKSHVQIRAATYLTAHVLKASDLWRVAVKHGKNSGQNFILQSSFEEHFERVKRHYAMRVKQEVKYKSSIVHFKHNIIALKEASDENGRPLLERNEVFLEISGCYIMRNRADACLSDESDAICLRPTFPCILQPRSSLQTVWSAFVAMIILLVTFTHPYILVFLKESSLNFRFYDYAVTVIFALDILVHLSTGANAEEGVPITFRQTSSQQMMNRWLILDVLGTVPMFEFVGDGELAGLNKLLRLPKTFRFLKTMEAVVVNHSNLLRFSSYSLLFVIAAFLTATIIQAFMCWHFSYCIVTNLTKSPYWEEKPLEDDTVAERIMFGLLCAVSMITFTADKIGSWRLNDYYQTCFTMATLEVIGILHIFFASVYSATIMVTSSMREEFEDSIYTVKGFLVRNNIDPTLRRRFVQYLKLCWYTDKAYSMTHKKNSILFDLPPHVYQDLLAMQRSKYILAIPIMKFLSKEALKEVSTKARLFYTSPNEILLSTGDIINEMYVIKRGTCQVLDPETEEVANLITVKDHFGTLECLLRFPAYYSIRAVTHVEIYSIARKNLLDSLTIPQIKNTMNFAKKQKEYNMLLQRREPFVAYEMPPPAANRQFFKLPRKHEPDTAFQQPFTRLGFLSVLRYIFPRYTLRPDGKYLRRYEAFRALCVLVTSFVFPTMNYMSLQFPWLGNVAFWLDMTAYYDLFQRMLVAYYNEDGILVYHPAATAGHYLKGAFVVDFIACFPLEFLDSGRRPMHKGLVRRTKTYQMLMLNRMVQLYRLLGAMDILGEGIERADILLVLKFIPLFMSVVSIVTCMLINRDLLIAKSKSEYGWFLEPNTNNTWLVNHKGTFRFDIMESPLNLHLATYFWVTYEMTCVGYNVFNSVNYSATMFLTIGIIIGYMMITYSSVRVIGIRSNINKPLASFQENIKDIMLYMKREKLDKDLQSEMMKYYEYNWDKMGGTDYRSVLKLCDQITLRTDAILHIYGQTFSKCSILHQCDVSLLRIVGRAVTSVYYQQGSTIIEKDDVVSDMYIVDHGIVDVESDVFTVGLQRGSLFGNLDPVRTVRFSKTIVADKNVHLLQINSLTFYKIIQDFPTVKSLMKKHRLDNEVYILGSQGDAVQKQWKERSLSTPILISQKSALKILHKHDFAIQFYLIVISLLDFYVDVYNTGFQDNRVPLIVFLYIMDMGFFFKILFNYSLPFFVSDKNDKLIMYDKRHKYLKSEFRYDIGSCLPIELVCLVYPKKRWLWWSLLRTNRVLRLMTVYKCLKQHKAKLNINLVLSTIVSVAIWFTVFIHVTTCLWHACSMIEDSFTPKSSWQYDKYGESLCENKYICSLYFIMTTFTQNGVGDIMPMTQWEVAFVTVFLIISTMVFMVYVGEFSNIIQYQQFRSFTFYSMCMELREFLRNNRVSINLVKMVDRYVLHIWRKTRGLQMPTFLCTAPPVLKQKIMSAAYMHHLKAHPSFKHCEPAFLRQLVGHFKLYIYNDGMYVVKENEITDSMYFVHTGRIQESAEDLEQVTAQFGAGEQFGTVNGLYRDTAFSHSYKTVTNAQVLTLHLNDWEYLLKHFPDCKKSIYDNEHDTKPDTDTELDAAVMETDGRGGKKEDKKKVHHDEVGEESKKSPLYQSRKEDDSKSLKPPALTPKGLPTDVGISSASGAAATVAAAAGAAATGVATASGAIPDSPFPISWRQASTIGNPLELARQQNAEKGALAPIGRPSGINLDKSLGKSPENVWPDARKAMDDKKDEPDIFKSPDKKKKGTRLVDVASESESDDDVYELTPEQLRRPSFVQKAMASAKKFLAKDIDEAAEVKDDLLLAQDEATTEALLKSIEKQNASKYDLTLEDTSKAKNESKSTDDVEDPPLLTKKADFLSHSFSYLGLNLKGSQPELKSNASLDEFLKREMEKETEVPEEKDENTEKRVKTNLPIRISTTSIDKKIDPTLFGKQETEIAIKTDSTIEKNVLPATEVDNNVKAGDQKSKPMSKSQAIKNNIDKEPVEEIYEDDLKDPIKEINVPKINIDDETDDPIFPKPKVKPIDEEAFEVLKFEFEEKDNEEKPRPKGVALAIAEEAKFDDDEEDVEKFLSEKKTKPILGLLSKGTKTGEVLDDEDEEAERVFKRRPTAFTRAPFSDEDDDDEDDEENEMADKLHKRRPTAFPVGKKKPTDDDDGDKQNSKNAGPSTATEQANKQHTDSPQKPAISEKENIESPWPLNNRRRSSYENVDRAAVSQELKKITDDESEEEYRPVINYTRRKSTVENVDRKAVEAELQALSSARASEVEKPSDSPWPLDSRRRSTVENVDRKAVELELQQLEDAKQPEIKKTETVIVESDDDFDVAESYTQLMKRPSTVQRFIGSAKKMLKSETGENSQDALLRQQDEATTDTLLKSYEMKSKSSKPTSLLSRSDESLHNFLRAPSFVDVQKKGPLLPDTAKAHESGVQPVPSGDTLHTIASVVSEGSLEELMKKEDQSQLEARLSRRTTRVRYIEEPSVQEISAHQPSADQEQEEQKKQSKPKRPKDFSDFY